MKVIEQNRLKVRPSHSSPKYPFAHPPRFEEKVGVFVHIRCSVPWWTGTAVELEAKGQASAQSTTGTVTCGANKKIKWRR